MNSHHTDLKDIILNVKHPVAIKNQKIPWPCMDMTFEAWCTELDTANKNDNELEFDAGHQLYHNEPQWERTRGKVKMTASEFLNRSARNEMRPDGSWIYYNYKNIKELPATSCCRNIDFEFLGFPEIRDDITVWFGSSGAHTPCHYDTYGCNIVVQVYGRKSWLLFPPDAKLGVTRVPYEESSIYCKENLYSPPNFDQFNAVKDSAYHIVLNPGEILVVPPKWWHYVENVEPSLNFNTWVPLERDTDSQIDECIVGIVMREFIQNTSNEVQNIIFNPNEDINFNSNSLYSILNVLINTIGSDCKPEPRLLVQQQQQPQQNNDDDENEIIIAKKRIKFHKYPSFYLENENYMSLLNKYNNILNFVTKISVSCFENIIQNNSKRFVHHVANCGTATTTHNFDGTDKMVDNLNDDSNSMINLLNSICNPNVIKLIRELYVLQQKGTR